MATSNKVSDSLFLVKQELSLAVSKETSISVNHIAVIDCSGSMYQDLPLIRNQLKSRIPKLLRDGDTLSIIWFSGRNQFGVLFEAEPVSTLLDLQEINFAIDKFLRPIGLTGFREPMEEVSALITRVGKKNSNPFALFFMSDGCDNQWGITSILDATSKAASGLSSATFVEYGYYADRKMMTAMAEKSGGSVIFSSDFSSYVPLFESAITKKLSGAKRINVAISSDAVGGFIFALKDGEILSFEVSHLEAQIPNDVSEIWYLSQSPQEDFGPPISELSKLAYAGSNEIEISAIYAAVSLFSLRANPKVILPLLKSLGDVHLITSYGGCFGKQKYTEFMEAAKEAAFGTNRFSSGWDLNRVPQDDAFTVLHLLEILAGDNENRVMLDDSKFQYNRISRERLDVSENLTVSECKKIQELSERIASERDALKLKEINDELYAITSSKKKALKFKAIISLSGYSISNLTFNEERPNVSILVRKEGTVDISDRITEFDNIPETFRTFIFRNYAIIKDGMLNVDCLPVLLTPKTKKLLEEEVSSQRAPANLMQYRNGSMVLNLRGLPIVNANMVSSLNASDFMKKQWILIKERAVQKVLNSVLKEQGKTVSGVFKERYGEAAATWLKEQGITEYGGFSAPKTVQAEEKDFYFGKELKVSIKGFSSLPSLNDVRKRIASGKLTPSAAIMATTVNELTEFLESNNYTSSQNQKLAIESWVEPRLALAKKNIAKLILEMAMVRFSIIVGQVWFNEFFSNEENEIVVPIDGVDFTCKIEMRGVKISI